MAHLRVRYALTPFQELLKFSPIVGVFGHRQVGKTTFLEGVCQDYKTLDVAADCALANADPESFVAGLRGLASGIDECQLAPVLFPALKERVRKNKKPGQFILSGSVRFYSRQAVRESLTGRMASVELLPFTLSELCGAPLPELIFRLLKLKGFPLSGVPVLASVSTLRERTQKMDLYLRAGGLPGVCFIRNSRLRNERLLEQTQTILDRDLRLIYPSTLPLERIFSFVRLLAENEGEPAHPTRLRRVTGIAEVTQQKLIHALTSLFVIRLLPVEGDRVGFAVFFEDQAELALLSGEKLESEQAFSSLVYRNVRASFNYSLGMDARFFQYRSRAGSIVPFAVRAGERTIGFIPVFDKEPSRAQLFAGQSFLRKYGDAKVIFVTRGNYEARVINDRTLRLPAEVLLFE